MENKDKPVLLCPECGGPCTMTWSGLELVENTGDETLATKHYHSKAPDMYALLKEAKEALLRVSDDVSSGDYDGGISMATDNLNKLLISKINKLFEE